MVNLMQVARELFAKEPNSAFGPVDPVRAIILPGFRTFGASRPNRLLLRRDTVRH